LAPRDDGASSRRNPNPDPQAEVTRLIAEIERLKRNASYWKQFNTESLEKEMEARARARDVELYVENLEQYNAILHEEVHRLYDLMNPNHQPQATEDDVGAVVVPGGEEDQEENAEEEDLEGFEPLLESGEEASHVTGMSAMESEDGVIVISGDDEE
jgi:hypothetical protein